MAVPGTPDVGPAPATSGQPNHLSRGRRQTKRSNQSPGAGLAPRGIGRWHFGHSSTVAAHATW